jgi:hypothetical protein
VDGLNQSGSEVLAYSKNVKETLYTQTLARAAEAEGGTAALASLLHVPQNTLERWMSGRAQTPLRAFLKALERLTAHEASGVAPPAPPTNGEPLQFRMGQLLARCNRCDSTEFAPADPGAPLRLTSKLVCRACGEAVVHGNLIAQLAQDAVLHSHAMTAARSRRQTELSRATRKKPDAVR